MAYRQFSTGTWQDPWFEKLSLKARMLFIYLWTNDVCNQAGIYQISKRRIEFEIGFKLDDSINELAPKVLWFDDIEVIWVKNFFRWQCQNPKFAFSAVRCLSSIPKKIVDQFIEYNMLLIEKVGIDTVSIPYSDEPICEMIGMPSVSLSVTEQNSNRTEQNSNTASREFGFDEFWKAYPKRVGKQEARKAWIRQNGNRPKLDLIISKINDLKKTDQWQKEKGQFIPNPATWLNRGGWDDEVDVSQIEQDGVCYVPIN